MTSPDQLAAYVTAFIFAVAAGYERFKSNKTKAKTEVDNETLSLAKASQERANLLSSILDETKAILAQEREEHKKTRDFWHDENGKSQVLLANANLKVLELQDRPDFREILTEMRAQGVALKAQGEALHKILELVVTKTL